MPRKVKQKQKQKQKQSQTVIVNINKGKRSKRQEKQTRQPPPPPQFVPYPVPSLRGPEPMVASQPSLIQMLEALRPIQAPIVAPAVPPPIVIPYVADEKQEVGPDVMVQRTPPIVEPDSALVSAGPAPSSSSSSSSSSASFEYLSREQLTKMPINRSRRSYAGSQSLLEYAQSLGISIPKFMPDTETRPSKEFIIELLLNNIPRQKIKRPIPAKKEKST
jgi:hypothetical protein